MISSLLADNTLYTWIILGVFVVILIAMFVLSSRKNKKRQQEAQEMLDAVKPGVKVKTIGGVCGIVVEVDDEENTFVLETGSETSGKCFMKFDKQAIFQSDAKLDKETQEKSEPEDGEESEQAVPADPFEETAEAEQPKEENDG